MGKTDVWLGLFIGLATMAAPIAFPAWPQWLALLIFCIGLCGTAVCIILLILRRRADMVLRLKNIEIRNFDNTPIRMEGDAELETDNLVSIGNNGLIEMKDRAKAKMRNTYHDARRPHPADDKSEG